MGAGGRMEYPAKERTAQGSPTTAHSAGMLRNRRVVWWKGRIGVVREVGMDTMSLSQGMAKCPAWVRALESSAKCGLSVDMVTCTFVLEPLPVTPIGRDGSWSWEDRCSQRNMVSAGSRSAATGAAPTRRM